MPTISPLCPPGKNGVKPTTTPPSSSTTTTPAATADSSVTTTTTSDVAKTETETSATTTSTQSATATATTSDEPSKDSPVKDNQKVVPENGDVKVNGDKEKQEGDNKVTTE